MIPRYKVFPQEDKSDQAASVSVGISYLRIAIDSFFHKSFYKNDNEFIVYNGIWSYP